MVTLWFDKDGVLAQHDYTYYEGTLGGPSPWTVRNAHIYRSCPENESMCRAFRSLYSKVSNVKPSERLCNVHVLTSVYDSVTLSEHVLDGAYWCKEHLGLRSCDFFATAAPKVSVPVNLRSQLQKTDVLLDDFMPNLLAWEEAGGTAIKVLNGINSLTDALPCISIDNSAADLFSMFLQIIEDVEGDCLGTGLINLRV